MKKIAFCIAPLLFFTIIAHAQGQQPDAKEGTATEIERLRREYQQQKVEIEKLRIELREVADLRRQQQSLLESLVLKLDKLGAAFAASEGRDSVKGVEVVNASLATPGASTAQPAASAQKDDPPGGKQQDKTQNVVESGFGKVKFTGLVQGWYFGGNAGTTDTFRIRRAEMKFTGQILPEVKWTVMLDLAKALSLNTTTTNIGGTPVIRDVTVNQSSRILQEAFVTLTYFKRANLNIGQFKLPVSQEALQSSAALDTIERALFLTDRSRGGGLGDVRDFGIMVFGPLGTQVDYQFGVFNGSGETQNDVDRTDQKAFAGRLVFKPAVIKGLQFGGSGVWGNGHRTGNPRRDRLGAELVYHRDKFKFKTEFMTGVDGDIHRRGYYAHFGYRFLPKYEAIFRYDTFDPDTRREATPATVMERDYIGGLNYYIKENNFKLQFNYLRKTFTSAITPSKNIFIVNLQTAW